MAVMRRNGGWAFAAWVGDPDRGRRQVWRREVAQTRRFRSRGMRPRCLSRLPRSATGKSPILDACFGRRLVLTSLMWAWGSAGVVCEVGGQGAEELFDGVAGDHDSAAEGERRDVAPAHALVGGGS